MTKWRDLGEDPKLHLFGQLKRIAKQWLDNYLICKGGTYQGNERPTAQFGPPRFSTNLRPIC